MVTDAELATAAAAVGWDPLKRDVEVALEKWSDHAHDQLDELFDEHIRLFEEKWELKPGGPFRPLMTIPARHT